MSQQKIEILEKALQRERLARKEAEKILEDKSLELYETNQNLTKVLSEKEIQLKALFKTIVDPYILIDLYGNVLKMNDASVNFFGYDIEKESFNVMATLHKDDYEYAQKSFKTLLEEGQFKNFKARIFNKKKQLKWVEINSSIVYDEMNKPIFAQGLIRDITKQKHQQTRFNEQKEQLNLIVDNSSIGIVLSQKNNIVKTNKAFQKFLGFNEDELNKLTIRDISLKEDYPKSKKYLNKLFTGELDYFSVKKRYLKKDQSIVWAQTNVSVVRNKDGSVKYQVALVEDITEKLKKEKERENLLKTLTISNKELKDFAHVVSHDLKSPLRSMNTLVTWLQEDCDDFATEEIRKNFDHLLRKIDKMDHLINGILKYASVDKIEHKKKDIDLNIIVGEIIDTIHIPEHINIIIPKKLPIIKGDKFRLHQLFQNLISNAIKYSKKENGYVKILFDETHSYFKFSIEDNGIGIKEQYHQKIFDIFQTLDDKQNSTGVGLSIVTKILAIYNGKISLKSTHGKGTTFNFTLPK